MRIRGSVARVLGSPSVFFPLSSLPISAPAAPPPPAEPTPHCELNCSPWDVDDDSMMEDEDGMAGETVDEQQPPAAAAASAAVTAETETSDKVEIKDEEMNKAIMEEDGQNVTDQNTAKKTCSKKGKGWKCTRPAELLHPFCLYHLTILRSYKSGRRPNSTANRLPSSSRSSARKRTWKKKLAAAAAAAAADPDSFVYYDLFAPGRGKRSSGVKIKEDEEKGACQKDPRFNALVVNGDEHAAEEPLTPKKANAKKMKSGIVYCKKNDGKGWSCKRPAALPSFFCSHHLSQMKAYSSNQYQNSKKLIEINSMTTSDASKIKKPQTPSATPHESRGKKQAVSKKRKAAAASSSSRLNDFYFSASNVKDFYYYGKYMPWRKKRGARAEILEAQAQSQAQAEEVQEEALVKEVKEIGEKKNSGRAEKFVKGIIDINVPPADDEDDGDDVA